MSIVDPKNFPSNSIHASDPAKEKVQKQKSVVKGTIRQRKTPLLTQIFAGEGAKEIWDYIMWEVLVPAAKSTIDDIVSNTIEMALYGSTGNRRSNRLRRDRGRTLVSYSSLYNDRRTTSRHRTTKREPGNRRTTDRHRFEDIIIETRTDAEIVLSTLIDLIDQYDLASVADFYDALGLGSEYTDRRYGWDDLNQASVRPVRGGYILELPKPYPID